MRLFTMRPAKYVKSGARVGAQLRYHIFVSLLYYVNSFVAHVCRSWIVDVGLY